jgi:surface antigen
MDKDKIDRFVDAFRTAMYNEFSVNEEGMVANPPGGSGGFSGSSPAAGPTAGYDSTLKLDGRNKFVRRAIKDLMDRQQKRKERKAKKKALDYNPYFKPQDGRSS